MGDKIAERKVSVEAQLASQLEQLGKESPEQWYVVREPHGYEDGTEYFTHVEYKTKDSEGKELCVILAQYLSEETAELMVLLHNNLQQIVRALRVAHVWPPTETE